MSVLTEIKTKLDALGTLGTIVVGYMPPSPDVIGVLQEFGGFAPERGFGVSGPKYERPSFQLMFRGVPYDVSGPRAKAETAWRHLMTIQPGALGSGVSTVYLDINPQQTPFPIAPMDSNYRHYIGCNFDLRKEPS